MIKRYLHDFLNKQLDRYPAVFLLGARQVGKTTLAKKLAQTRPSIYLDLEMPETLLKLSSPELFLREHSDKLIIFDEIQRTPDLFTVLRGIIDMNKERGFTSGQFLLLGSASMDLLRQSSESLAGRIRYCDLYGLILLEANHPQQLWLRGGFPQSFLAQDNAFAMDWLEELIRTYLERDIPQMGFQISSNKLRRLWTMLAHLQGETINVSQLANNLDLSRTTVDHSIHLLCDLFLVRRLNPWHANVKKRLIKSPRYYIRDSGIQHRLLGIEHYEELLANPTCGKSWEGFVIENIQALLPRRAETYFYRTASGLEIDLVIKFSVSQIWAVEIKRSLAPKISKHFSQACEDIGATEKYVIYGGEDCFTIRENITVISLLAFLQKLDQKEAS